MFSFERMEIERDKANHFVYGSLTTLCTLALSGSAILSLLLCAVVALLKEVWDFFYGSGFDWMDLAWTVIGGLVVIGAFFVAQR